MQRLANKPVVTTGCWIRDRRIERGLEEVANFERWAIRRTVMRGMLQSNKVRSHCTFQIAEKIARTDIKNKLFVAPWEDAFLVIPAPYHPGIPNRIKHSDLIAQARR